MQADFMVGIDGVGWVAVDGWMVGQWPGWRGEDVRYGTVVTVVLVVVVLVLMNP